MEAFSIGRTDIITTQVYMVHGLHAFLVDEIVSRCGLSWCYTCPTAETVQYRGLTLTMRVFRRRIKA